MRACTPSSPDKAIDFWLAARTLAAVTLLVAVLLSWRSLTSASSRYIMLAVVLIVVGCLHGLFLFYPEYTPSTFIPGSGLTQFKIYYEYALVALSLVTAFILWVRMRGSLAFNGAGLFGAVCMMALSEYLFTLYSDVEGVTAVITNFLTPYKAQCHTMMFDNGKEFAEHEKVAEELKSDIYFALVTHGNEG